MSSLLKLERPFCILDLETTGNVEDLDRVIQIGVEMYYPDAEPKAWKTYVDPEVAIPVEIAQKIKITDADVAGAPVFRTLAEPLSRKFTGCDFGGYNVDFDLKFMRAEMRRAEIDWDWERNGAHVIDSRSIFFKYFPRTLEDAYKEYVDPRGFAGAHDASNDVRATATVLTNQLLRHENLPRTVPELAAFFDRRKDNPGWIDKAGKIVWRNKVACLAFGKWKGTPLAECERGYLRYILEHDFPADVKTIVDKALNGDYPKWIPRS